MTELMSVPDAFVFMKIGHHGGEPLEQVLVRKQKEKRAGAIFWGYGGSACHPFTQVQPFAKLQLGREGFVYLLMQTVSSKVDPALPPAQDYSEDGRKWRPIPEGVRVTGSRYAVLLDDIQPSDLQVNLSEFVIAIGPSSGKRASEYLRGHTDKACLLRADSPGSSAKLAPVRFVARLQPPFAVVLR